MSLTTNTKTFSASPSRALPSAIRLTVVVPRLEEFFITVNQEAPISTILTAVRDYMISIQVEPKFTAYVTLQDFPRSRYAAFRRGSCLTTIKYNMGAEELDPTKTVGEYFGDAPGKALHVVLQRLPVRVRVQWMLRIHQLES